MILHFNMVFGPLLLLAGLAFRINWREAVSPLVAGALLTASWAAVLFLRSSSIIGLLWMLAPGAAGILLLFQAMRTGFGAVAQGLYFASGLLCIVPTLIFAFIFYALSGPSHGV